MRRLRLFAIAASVSAISAVLGCTPTASTGAGLQVRSGSVCAAAAAAASTVAGVVTSMVGTPGSPFGVAANPDGRWVFASTDHAFVAYAIAGNTLTRASEVPVPGSPSGIAVTGDGRYVLVATGHGAVVVDARQLEAHASAARLAPPSPRDSLTRRSRGSDKNEPQ